MPHILAPMHVLVDVLHDLTRVETIALSKIDKQPFIARFGLMFAPSVADFPTHLLAIAFTSGVFPHHRLLDFGRMLIVIQKTSESNRYHFLNQILFINIFELAHNVGHIGGYLVFINIGFHDVVHHFEKLFLADFLGLRQFSVDKLLSNLFLYLLHFPLFLDVDDAD